jgi:hypothetical protein
MWTKNEKKMIGGWSQIEWKLEMTDPQQNCAVVTLVYPGSIASVINVNVKRLKLKQG